MNEAASGTASDDATVLIQQLTAENEEYRKLTGRALDAKNARINELMTMCSKLENERRMWKQRAKAAQSILAEVFVDVAVSARALLLDGASDVSVRNVAEALDVTRAVAERADMLERDAWTAWAPHVRAFIAQAREPMGDYAPDIAVPAEDEGPAGLFVRAWVTRFSSLFKDD